MSLRTRLIAGLLALTAIGLVALAGITYAEQRSFQLDRVDQQVRSALPPIDRALDQRGYGAPGFRGPDGGGPGPGARDVSLPPGTYGERRTSADRVVGAVVLSYGQTGLPK